MLNHHQPQPGATRTRVTDSRRFTPYGRYGVHPIVYEETEVGPSLYVPPPIPHDATPTMIPAGGIPKTTAHAEHKQSNTEEQESPVSDFYCSPIPRVADCLLDVRRPRPGVPVAKGSHAPIVGGPKRVPASYGNGRRCMGDSGCSQVIRTR